MSERLEVEEEEQEGGGSDRSASTGKTSNDALMHCDEEKYTSNKGERKAEWK